MIFLNARCIGIGYGTGARCVCLGCRNCKNRLPYNLYCVGGDVKHCSLTRCQNCCTYQFCVFLGLWSDLSRKIGQRDHMLSRMVLIRTVRRHSGMLYYLDLTNIFWAREHCRRTQSRFLAECHKRQVNQASFVLLCHALFAFFWVVFSFCIFNLSFVRTVFPSMNQHEWHCIA